MGATVRKPSRSMLINLFYITKIVSFIFQLLSLGNRNNGKLDDINKITDWKVGQSAKFNFLWLRLILQRPPVYVLCLQRITKFHLTA